MSGCHYCHRVATNYEMDHFPIPRRRGGIETVPVCHMCHSLKDRIPAERWPPDLYNAGTSALVAVINQPQIDRPLLRLSSLDPSYPRVAYDFLLEVWRDHQGNLGMAGRLFVAKALAVFADIDADAEIPKAAA